MILAMVIDPKSAIAQNGWHPRSRYSLAPPAAYGTVSPSSMVRDDQGEGDDLKQSSSVRGLAHLVGLSSQITFCFMLDINFLLTLALTYWKGWPRLVGA
jgi:hypothetical protein